MNMELAQAQIEQIVATIGKQFEASVQRFKQDLEHNPGITRAVEELHTIKDYDDEEIS